MGPSDLIARASCARAGVGGVESEVREGTACPVGGEKLKATEAERCAHRISGRWWFRNPSWRLARVGSAFLGVRLGQKTQGGRA